MSDAQGWQTRWLREMPSILKLGPSKCNTAFNVSETWIASQKGQFV